VAPATGARLVAAAVSAHEARFDPATEHDNITDFDFLKRFSILSLAVKT
jgi:hypothetical protein